MQLGATHQGAVKAGPASQRTKKEVLETQGAAMLLGFPEKDGVGTVQAHVKPPSTLGLRSPAGVRDSEPALEEQLGGICKGLSLALLWGGSPPVPTRLPSTCHACFCRHRAHPTL